MNKLITKLIIHTKTILVHKWNVFKFCVHAGIIWRGLMHDVSKFYPTEFMESIKYADGKVSPILTCKKQHGVSKAWLHHKGRNPHHYEYWQDSFDEGGKSVQMPFVYALEQICDFLGAGKAYMKKDFSYKKEYEWWITKKQYTLAMHPQTQLFTELMLSKISKENSIDCLRKSEALKIYEYAESLVRKNHNVGITFKR